MKQIIGILMVLVFGIVGIALAGDKEELRLKQQMLQERIGRIQATFSLLDYQYKEAQSELIQIQKQIADMENKEKEVPGK